MSAAIADQHDESISMAMIGHARLHLSDRLTIRDGHSNLAIMIQDIPSMYLYNQHTSRIPLI